MVCVLPNRDLCVCDFGICDTVDSVLSGLCVKRTSVLSGQIFWSRQNTPLF